MSNEQVALPYFGKITQGSIFCYAPNYNYEIDFSYGLIVTARCDIVNFESKGVQCLHYVPVVPFSMWMEREGLYISLSYAIKDALNKLDSECLGKDISIEALLNIGNIEICRKIIKSKDDLKLTEKFENYAMLISMSSLPFLELKKHVKIFKSQIYQLTKEIVLNSKIGYYFLRQIDPDAVCGENFICLFREIHSISSEIAINLHNGIMLSDFCKKNNDDGIENEKVVEQISRVTSPDIEALMQSFSAIFTRVGIPTRYNPRVYAKTVMDGCYEILGH